MLIPTIPTEIPRPAWWRCEERAQKTVRTMKAARRARVWVMARWEASLKSRRGLKGRAGWGGGGLGPGREGLGFVRYRFGRRDGVNVLAAGAVA